MEFSSSSSLGSSKRAKAPGGGASVSVCCLVDGCNSDLSQCREYYRRHKVCELHFKASKVMIGGREQRFCQQCSRFHSLGEFDDEKRSCRKRLDGHNRRRRKHQPDSMSRTSTSFPSSQQGTKLVTFSNPQIHPSAGVTSNWAGPSGVGSEVSLLNSHQAVSYAEEHSLFQDPSARAYKGGTTANQFQFLQSTDRILPEASEGLYQTDDSDRALSLLSSAPAQTSSVGSTPMSQPGPVSPAQLSGPSLQFHGLGQHPFAISSSNNGDNNATHPVQGMFDSGPDCSSSSGAQETLSFRWE